MQQQTAMHVVVSLPNDMFECKLCGLTGDLDTLMRVGCEKVAKMQELEPRRL